MPGRDSSGNGIEVGLDDLQPGAIGTTTPGTATSPSMHAGLKPRHFVALEGGRTQRYPTSQTRLVDLTARVEKMAVGYRKSQLNESEEGLGYVAIIRIGDTTSQTLKIIKILGAS